MKLLALVVAGCLASSTLASAEGVVLTPPGGPVYADEVDYVDVTDKQPRARTRALKQALMEHFDTNGDGRLGPRERMRAARVLAKVAHALAQPAMQRSKRERIIRKFDRNRDGRVDGGELPPRAARKLRRFDRDGDGWVEPGELR